MPLCRTTAKKTSIASASIFFILCFLLSLLRNAFVTKLKECSNHDEILYICCLVFEILLLVSCVRAPEEFFLPESCNRAAGKKLLDVFIDIFFVARSIGVASLRFNVDAHIFFFVPLRVTHFMS